MLIVDAYNVLNVEGVLPTHLAGIDLMGLITLLRTSRYRARPTTLVCDGHLARQRRASDAVRANGRPSAITIDSVRLVFSGAHEEADDVIEGLLAHHQGSGQILMVSSDRRLQRAARKWGAQPLDSHQFLHQLALDESRSPQQGYPKFAQQTPLSRADLAWWMREFGVGEPEEREVVRTPEPVPEPEPARSPKPGAAQTQPTVDAMLARLVRESGMSIDLAELDMERWIRAIEPFRPPSL